MEVEPRSRAMRRAKDDARRKRRTTVIDSSQMPVQSWIGCAGSTAASWRTSPAARHVATHRKCRRHGGLAVEAADGGVGAKYSRLSRGLDRPIAVPQAGSVWQVWHDE